MSHPSSFSIDLSRYSIDERLIKEIPSALVIQYQFMPVFKIGKTLTIATAEPDNLDVMDDIQKSVGMEVEALYAEPKSIKRAIEHHYGFLGSIDDLIREVNADEQPILTEVSETSLLDISTRQRNAAPVVQLVNLIISQAIIKDASDIHIEPSEMEILVRIRIDGELQILKILPLSLLRALVSRIKVLGQMDIAESRIPQDGQIRIKYEDARMELRISTLPTIYGENIVIRLLGKKNLALDLQELGFLPEDQRNLETMLAVTQGMLLVSGPTGSGKTTTLYAGLSHVNKDTKNIVTLEDPVEYKLPMIRQVQVNNKSGLTFAAGLRSILRQDPDIIMVGEIRDLETAELAVRAALTGHFVLSTLHTNDAPSTLVRLIDMGIPSFLISSALTGVISQRLSRRVCVQCRDIYQPDFMSMIALGLDPDRAYFKGKGCKNCHFTGYKGRVALYEILPITDQLVQSLVPNTPAPLLRKMAIESGMTTMKDDGVQKILMNLTTVEEVYKHVKSFLQS
jgi:type IV pilus assembly protein PilB